MGEQVFGMIDPKLDQVLMNGRPKTMTETAGEVTCRKRARDCQFVDRNISPETCPQHLLGTELLPSLETLSWTARELRRTAMLLQSVGAEHHRDMV